MVCLCKRGKKDQTQGVSVACTHQGPRVVHGVTSGLMQPSCAMQGMGSLVYAALCLTVIQWLHPPALGMQNSVGT